MQESVPPHLDVVDLLPKLDEQLLSLLKSLTPEEWHYQTVASQWKVKDVVAHLLDGNIRILSMLQDHYFGDPPVEVQSYQQLVEYLNRLNADWVKAMKRVSPSMLILLHEMTGPLFCRYYKTLNPFDNALFSVAWAGEEVSKNWMHIAREYTEKFHHQQQIRDAVGNQGLMTRTYFYPFINILMQGLSHAYREVGAEEHTCIQVTISSEIGGSWFLIRQKSHWTLQYESVYPIKSHVIISPDVSWKLFTKSIRPEQIKSGIEIHGDYPLGQQALMMVSVMA